ncbi:MAG: replication factor C large subunit [Halobacteriaceae archaeon]
MSDWTEKHRPETLTEVRGNDKARDALREWAEAWPDEGRAVILAGSPGVGKTSAAHALANDMGWERVEVNASDTRNTDAVERLVGRASRNTTLGGAENRQLLIVDEADSFHRSDAGGARALSDIVKEAAQPVVLIVNDQYEMPDGIRRRVDDIEFRDVSKRSIVPVLRDICRKEGIEFESEALDALAEKNSGDLRSAVNDLQALVETDRTLTADDVVTGERDRSADIWSFLDAVLKEKSAEDALYTTYDVDETPDDLLLWVEDKAPKVYDTEELAAAYEFMANADRWLGRVRATQNYSYWRYATDNLAAGVAAAREETRGGWTRYGGAPYRSSKDGVRDYVAERIAAESGVSVGTARRDVLPFLAAMTHHCKPRELTVAMAAAYDFEEEHVAFVTGSGETTNKVQSIVADAEEMREAAVTEHAGDAFAGSHGAEKSETPTVEEEADGEDEDENSEAQTGLADFT